MLHISVLFVSSMASPFYFLILVSIFTLNYFAISLFALKVHVGGNTGLSLAKECSNKCESSFCKVPPLLRYGKYCGILYSGCPGEKPCDELDACCMKHDACISANNNNYLSEVCNQGLLSCVERFKKAGSKTFKGNTCDANDVTNTISLVMNAAVLAGRYIHKPSN
ncbi:Phospholipase A2, active site-containing protein [Artemisia annua]|uniref:phospholipase A2 n=1 Tax=Artemisia annua TaxID=35608 RepID=A0A2U1LU72_ARTAN|nr:Phospholipase A2, active site-containing protein [Artemisia annua]